ncbi:MAG: AarF/ABC1/UbiB kinase family protein [Ornithinimicrobium sp.]
MLSTRPDLIGPEYAAALSRLHSEVAPQAWPKVQHTLEAELCGAISEVFEHLEETPMAAASIAQIHRARLKNGDPVVVKVQRSDARRQVTADLDIVTRLARWLDRVTPWARNLGVRDLAEGFAASLDEELGFRVEARNIQSIAVNATSVRVPTVHTSTRRVLVMEEMPGRPLSAAGVVGMSVERRRELADVLLNAILSQVLTFGVFHADLHAGNVLLDTSAAETNGLSLLDFGSVGRLDRGTRTSLGLLLLAVDRQDAAGATTALTDLLDGPVGASGRALERDLGQVIMRHSVGSPAEEMFRDLYRLVLRHGLRIPPPMAAAFRSLASLDGTLMLLTPDRDLLGSAKAQGHKLLSKDLSPQGVRATLEDQLAGLIPILQRIPQQLSSVIDDVEAGRFTVTVRALQDEHERNFLTGLVQQAVISLLAATCALSGVLLVLDSSGPMMTPVLPLTTFSGTILLLIAFVLGSRVLVQTLRDSWSQRRN